MLLYVFICVSLLAEHRPESDFAMISRDGVFLFLKESANCCPPWTGTARVDYTKCFGAGYNKPRVLDAQAMRWCAVSNDKSSWTTAPTGEGCYFVSSTHRDIEDKVAVRTRHLETLLRSRVIKWRVGVMSCNEGVSSNSRCLIVHVRRRGLADGGRHMRYRYDEIKQAAL